MYYSLVRKKYNAISSKFGDGIFKKKIWEERKKEKLENVLKNIKEPMIIRHWFPFLVDWDEKGKKVNFLESGTSVFKLNWDHFKTKDYLCIYENYEDNVNLKFFLDLDSKDNVNPWTENDLMRVVKSIKILVPTFFKNKYGIDLDSENDLIFIESSSFPKIFSLHVLVTEKICIHGWKAMKVLSEEFIRWIKTKDEYEKEKENLFYMKIVKKKKDDSLKDNSTKDDSTKYDSLKESKCEEEDQEESTRETIVDSIVYDFGRCMRILWCCKSSDLQRVLRLYCYGLRKREKYSDIIELEIEKEENGMENLKEIFFDSMIHYTKPNMKIIEPNHSKVMQVFIPVTESESPSKTLKRKDENNNVESNGKKTKQDQSIVLSNDLQILKILLVKWIQNSFPSIKTSIIKFERKEDRIEIIPECSFCPLKNGDHTNPNKFRILIRRNEKNKPLIFVSCYSGKCKKKRERKSLNQKLFQDKIMKSIIPLLKDDLKQIDVYDKYDENQKDIDYIPDDQIAKETKKWEDWGDVENLIGMDLSSLCDLNIQPIKNLKLVPFRLTGIHVLTKESHRVKFNGNNHLEVKKFLFSHFNICFYSNMAETFQNELRRDIKEITKPITQCLSEILFQNTVLCENNQFYRVLPNGFWKGYGSFKTLSQLMQDLFIMIIVKTLIETQNSFWICYYDEIGKNSKTFRETSVFKITLEIIEEKFEEHISKDWFDHQNDHLIPLKNGKVINLKTLELRPVKKEDKFLFRSNLELNEDFVNEIFNFLQNPNFIQKKEIEDKINEYCNPIFQWLASMFPEPETARFVLVCFGYFLSGDKSRKELFFWNGPANGGKSKTMEILHHLFGNFSIQLTNNLLTEITEKSKSSASPEMFDLDNKRFAFMPDMKQDAKFDITTIKQILGDSKFKCRKLYLNSIATIEASAHLVLASNYPPTFNLNDPSMECKIQIWDFAQQFVDQPENESQSKSNPELISKLMGIGSDNLIPQLSLSLVLGAWLYYNKYNDNLKSILPPRFKFKKESAIQQQDSFKPFLEENLSIGNEKDLWKDEWSLPLEKIHHSYLSWFHALNKTINPNAKPLSLEKIGEKLKKLGLGLQSKRKTVKGEKRTWYSPIMFGHSMQSFSKLEEDENELFNHHKDSFVFSF